MSTPTYAWDFPATLLFPPSFISKPDVLDLCLSASCRVWLHQQWSESPEGIEVVWKGPACERPPSPSVGNWLWQQALGLWTAVVRKPPDLCDPGAARLQRGKRGITSEVPNFSKTGVCVCSGGSSVHSPGNLLWPSTMKNAGDTCPAFPEKEATDMPLRSAAHSPLFSAPLRPWLSGSKSFGDRVMPGHVMLKGPWPRSGPGREGGAGGEAGVYLLGMGCSCVFHLLGGGTVARSKDRCPVLPSGYRPGVRFLWGSQSRQVLEEAGLWIPPAGLSKAHFPFTCPRGGD